MEAKVREREKRQAQLRDMVKTLRCKSSEVQAVCRAQQQQILEQQAREKDLQRRCEAAEQRVSELELELKCLRALPAVPARSALGADQELRRQQGLSGLESLGKVFAQVASERRSDPARVSERALMQSAFSICEGALGMVKAALATDTREVAGACHVDGPLRAEAEDESSRPSRLPQQSPPRPAGRMPPRPAAPNSPRKRQRVSREPVAPGSTTSEDPSEPPSTEQTASGSQLATEAGNAVDIVQAELARLSEGKPTMETLDSVANTLTVEMLIGRRCPLHCVVACIGLAVAECGYPSGGLRLSGMTGEGDDEQTSGGCEQQLLALEASGYPEKVSFASTWYDPQKRQQQLLARLVCCISRMHDLGCQDSGLLLAVAKELFKIVLPRGQSAAAGQECARCAAAAALALIHRLHSHSQAMGALLLTLLLSGEPSDSASALPVVAAAASMWPEAVRVLCYDTKEGRTIFARALIQSVCHGVLNQQKTDESTADDSVSQTTMTACVGNGIETAACYLQQLGRAFWEWPADGSNCPVSEWPQLHNTLQLWACHSVSPK